MVPPRNQNRPPRSPNAKKEVASTIDKRRKVEPPITGRRQAFSAVNRQDVTATSEVGSVEECSKLTFTNEEVEALLTEKQKTLKFDSKAKMEQMNERIKKLKLCVRWFQQEEKTNLQEKDEVKNALESAVKRHCDQEVEMKSKLEELSSAISHLTENNVSLQQKLSKEESDKAEAIDLHRREEVARVAAEKMQLDLAEDLKKSRQEIIDTRKKLTDSEVLYNRLQEYNTSLQQYNSKLQTDLESVRESLTRESKEKCQLVETLTHVRVANKSLHDQLTASRASQDEAVTEKESLITEVRGLRSELSLVRDDRDRQVAQVQSLVGEVAKYEENAGKSIQDTARLEERARCLEVTCSSQREQIQKLEHQLAVANEKLKMSDLSTSETRAEFEKHRRTICELQDRLADAERKLLEGEQLRKKLHNTILELKGNIRVFCRVRPLGPDEGAGTDASVIAYPTSTEALGRGIDIINNGQRSLFTFDKVFDHEAAQQEVFTEISQLVQSALDGYKVCIFAYGQTGSGKTYTMMGRPEAPEEKGLIPRSLEQIFQVSQALSGQGWKYKMQASMLEIYNETIRDLLSENGVQGKQYAIKHDATGNAYVSDLTIVDVCSIKEINSLLHQASQCRSVGKTHMNEQSSRSHLVFTLRISGTNENTDQQVQGVLNLIDLAGSERLSKSGATGDRLKETQAINKSLSSLSDVISALAKKEDHVPYRNSKLTYLLEPCLRGGDSKILMFVNISPESSSVSESLCSLKFAARVNSCEIGIPRRQTSTRSLESRLSYG